MQSVLKMNPLLRAVGVIGAVAVLVTGITLAALNSTATLTQNTISSATANLLVDGSDLGAIATSSEPGYSFTNLVPGGPASTAQPFSLTNSGTTDLDVTVYATIVAAGGSGTLDKSKVKVTFTNITEASVNATYSLAQLEAVFNNVPGSGNQATLGATILAGATENLTYSVQLEAGAVSGSGPVDVTNFSLVFTGTNEAELLP